MLGRYVPRSRQSKVIKYIQLLNWDCTYGEFVDKLQNFDKAVSKYEHEAGKAMDEEEKLA